MYCSKTFLAIALIIFSSFQASSKQPDYSKLSNSSEVYSQQKTRVKVTQVNSISKKESLRYFEIIKGVRGFLSPNLDPISILGIEARNDAKRRHYAELWVKQEYERTEKELKFQREVDAAWKRLMPNMLPVNMGNSEGIADDSGGRWLASALQEYLLATVYVAVVTLIRVTILVLSIPLFLVVVLVSVVDGLGRRDLRR